MGLRPATDLSRSGAGLPLALVGSLLLHLGILFGAPAPAPASPHAAQPLSVHLASAAPAALRPVSQPTVASAQHKIPPPRHLIVAHAVNHAAVQPAEPGPAAPETTMKAATNPVATSSEPAISPSTYYEGAQLDEPPHLLGEVQRIYPARARAADIEGSVTLSLLINEHGEVDKAIVISAQPSGYFEKAALDMLSKQRFTPAIIRHHPVKSRWRTVVRYRLQS
jgi:periplasmic protein TonB